MGAKKPHLSTIFSPASEKTQVVSQFLTHAVRRFRLGAIPETGLSENWLAAARALCPTNRGMAIPWQVDFLYLR
jgi:hypothetical protein